ncbi:hypothetical protein SUGI_0492990 [Cryptomeria japonica]|nr:hypothetical protein SUGI_0492990 [Cryptomeria japonica]
MHALYFSSLFLLSFLNIFAGDAEKAKALFVFGDSYGDTGNHDPYNETLNQPWKKPYGLTWPGYPAGRFSSGKFHFWALYFRAS